MGGAGDAEPYQVLSSRVWRSNASRASWRPSSRASRASGACAAGDALGFPRVLGAARSVTSRACPVEPRRWRSAVDMACSARSPRIDRDVVWGRIGATRSPRNRLHREVLPERAPCGINVGRSSRLIWLWEGRPNPGHSSCPVRPLKSVTRSAVYRAFRSCQPATRKGLNWEIPDVHTRHVERRFLSESDVQR